MKYHVYPGATLETSPELEEKIKDGKAVALIGGYGKNGADDIALGRRPLVAFTLMKMMRQCLQHSDRKLVASVKNSFNEMIENVLEDLNGEYMCEEEWR